MTRMQELEMRANYVGLTVRTWSPGDGVTRYKFFLKKENPDNFNSSDGINTEAGYKDASTYLRGYAHCKNKVGKKS